MKKQLAVLGVSALLFITMFSMTAAATPPGKPIPPSGETNGEIGIEYTYTSRAKDSDFDDLYYRFDFGDEITDWSAEPVSSGAYFSMNHTWTDPGLYAVKAQVKDINEELSEWSDPLNVTIIGSGEDVELQITDIEAFIGVQATIINNGTMDANGTGWSITTDGGFVLIGKNINGTINLPAGESTIVLSTIIFGIGKITIIVEASYDTQTVSEEIDAFLLGPFIFIQNE